MAETTIVQELVTLFEFEVDPSKIRQADQAVERFARRLGAAQQRTQSFGNTLRGTIARFAGFAAAAAGLRGIVTINRDFQQLSASIETVAGSAEAGAAAMERLNAFAASTPFELTALGETFRTLAAVGIEPTNEILTSFGNIASANARDITEFAAAARGAVTGEFEALKSFGIVARVEGERVRLTFRGVTTEIDRDAESITGFLQDIGDTQFAGAMERQMDTLGGAFSNLMDMVTRFSVAVGEAGLNDALQELVEAFSAGVEGSESLAQTLGEVLGGAVRVLTIGVRFLSENMEIVRAVLVAIGGRIVIGALLGLLGVITSLLTATVTWGAAIAGALLIIPLIIEDFIFFVQGHDSLIGRMIGQWRDDDGFLGAVVRTLEDIIRFGGQAFEFLLGDVARFVADSFEMLQGLAEFLFELVEEMEEATIRTELGEVEDQIADVDRQIQERRDTLTASGLDVRRGRTPEEREQISRQRQEALRDLLEQRERLVSQSDDLESRANARFETSRRGTELREAAEQRAIDQAEIARQAAATFEGGAGGGGVNIGAINVENQVEGALAPALGEEEMADATAAGAAEGVMAAAALRDLES